MQLSDCVTAIATEAAKWISLRDHVATHPRLGVLDHIACHHLGQPHQAESARSAACRIAAGVSRQLPSLPVILYGDASPQKLRLQDIRRACGAPSSRCSALHQLATMACSVSSNKASPPSGGHRLHHAVGCHALLEVCEQAASVRVMPDVRLWCVHACTRTYAMCGMQGTPRPCQYARRPAMAADSRETVCRLL